MRCALYECGGRRYKINSFNHRFGCCGALTCKDAYFAPLLGRGDLRRAALCLLFVGVGREETEEGHFESRSPRWLVLLDEAGVFLLCSGQVLTINEP